MQSAERPTSYTNITVKLVVIVISLASHDTEIVATREDNTRLMHR